MRDKTNLYAYTHKYKKHNVHKHSGSDGVFGDRRTAPSLHDITLKMRKMYDAVAGSFNSFNDPSKPFTAIDYRRIHNGWKNKKNRHFNRMNRMNRMKTMIGGVVNTECKEGESCASCIDDNPKSAGKTVYSLVADRISDDDDDDDSKSKSATVTISRTGKEDFNAFIEGLAANDAEKASAAAESAAEAAEAQRLAQAEAEAQRLAQSKAEAQRLAEAGAREAPAAVENVVVSEANPDIDEEGVFIKAAALTAAAVALAIATENEKSAVDDDEDGVFIKAAALASIATAMAIAQSDEK